jgi:hypothetical protein
MYTSKIQLPSATWLVELYGHDHEVQYRYFVDAQNAYEALVASDAAALVAKDARLAEFTLSLLPY